MTFPYYKSITRLLGRSLTMVLFLLSTRALSQNYPVTCTPIVKPSYSLKWSEINTSNDMFKVHLLLKDLTKPSVDVYLKIRLSGVGVDIRTIDGSIPSQTLTLIPGQPRMLTASDLAEYFNISNIVVDGVDISALYNGGRLPEGLYTWTVEAYEVDRNRQVSNTGMALMNVFKNYPPIINIPQDGAILPVTTPQNVLFSWTSRSTASLNAAQGKTYKLRIYPLSGTPPDSNDDPNVVTNSGIQPIEITTTNPYFSYGAGNISFEKGKRYAVQVQELDDTNADDYENEGKSQVVTFSYGKPCLAPEGMVVINPIGKGRVELTCEATAEDAETYPITAWYKTPKASIWNSVPFNGNSAVISGLKDKTDYEFKLSSACGENTNTMAPLRQEDMLPSGDPSTEPEIFKIDDSEFDEEDPEMIDPAILDPYTIGVEINTDGTTRPIETLDGIFSKIIKPECVTDANAYAECSPNHPDAPAITGTIELDALAVGDVLGIYDYAVLVTTIGGGNTLSGKGLVKLPFLDNSFMAVEFSGIKAKKGEAGTQGGCVYEVGDYFRTRPISNADLQNEQVKTIAEIIKLTEPTVFHGDLEVAIKKYQEKGSEIASKGTASPQEKQDLLTYTKGVEVAIGTWKDKFSEVFGSGETDPKIAEIIGDMTAILTQLNADKQTIEGGTPPAGTSYPTIPDLKAKVDVIIEKIKALQQENTPKPPRIQNVLATNIGYNDATLTWQGDPRFKKYVISYKTADGGELLETVTGNRLDLKKLQENSQYGFKIEGYVGDEVVDTYENGAFKTLQNKLPMPENVKQLKVNDNTLTLTWDKNKLHENYKIVYKDKNGVKRTIPLGKENTVTLRELSPDEKYEYSIVALDGNLESDPATGTFISSLCRGLIETSVTRLVEGTTITLTASNSCIDIISWNGVNTPTNQRNVSITPTVTTIYEVECTIEFKNGETKICNDKIEITVDKKCNDVVARATTYDITQGEEVGLIVKGCSSDVVWKDEKFATISTNNVWVNIPTKPQTYSVYCKNSSGEACAFQLPTIKIKCQIKLLENDYDANKNFFGVPSGSKIITLLGCENGTIDWSFSKEGQIEGKELKPNQYLISNIILSREAKIKAYCTRFGEKCESEELTIKRPNVLCGEYAADDPHKLSIEGGIKITSKWYNNEANANCSSILWSDGTYSTIIERGKPLIKTFTLPTKPTVFEGVAFVYGLGDNYTRECPFSIPYNPVINEVRSNTIPEIICTPFIATASKTNFNCEEPVTLSSKWCGVTENNTGIVTWEPAIPLNGIVMPTAREITYKATCQFNGQTLTSEVTLMRNPSKVWITLTDKSYQELYGNHIIAGNTVTLQSFGCYDDNCNKGNSEYYYQYYSPAGVALGFNKLASNSILINGAYKSVEFKTICKANGAEGQTKVFEIHVPNPCDFSAIVDDNHNNTPNVLGGLASITVSGCDLGKISWRNSNGGRGDINSNKKIEDNFAGSISYKITCNMNGQVANQPFCEKEVIIYRTEPKPTIKDDTKCSDFFQDTYEYNLGMAAGVQGSTPTYTPKEKAIYAGIDDYSANEVLLRLVASNCPSNVVAWYDSKGTKISDKNIVSIPFPSTSPAIYTSECTIKFNNGNTKPCPSTVRIYFYPDYIKEQNRILKNGRTAILQNNEFNNARQDNLVSQTTETTSTNCGFMTTQKAVGDILKNLICDNGKLVIEAPITTEKVEILKNTILQNPIFEDKGISLPPVTDAMITQIAAGGSQCQTVIDGLVKDIEGTSLKEQFNDLVSNPNLMDDVVENIDACITGVLKPLWETDGHFSTVYLIALQLGMSDTDARNLAIAAEDPDTDINFKTKEYIVDDTWANGSLQKIYHTLNGGFHGVEEFLTALGIMSTPTSDLKTLGFLIHRFGDTYAHTRLRSINPSDLNKLDIVGVKVEDGISQGEADILQKLMLSWQNVSSGIIENKVPEWMQLINEYVRKYGGNLDYGLVYKTSVWVNSRGERVKLSDFLVDVYKVYAQNPTKNGKLRLYGCSDCFMTLEHATLDGGMADYIFVRGNWYLSYVKNLAALLKYKFNLPGKIDIDVFQRMVNYVTTNKCSMRGVIDVEIALQNKKNNVDIYKFLTNWQAHTIGYYAIKDEDLELQYKNDIARVRDYLINIKNKEIVNETSSLGNFTRFIFHNKCKN